jgi:hypothetical protein
VSDADDVARILDRLKRDHPDPALREQLYRDGKLSAYVAALLDHGSDRAAVDRIAGAVRAADDGQPGPMTA